MKTLKRILITAMAAVFVLTLAGCSAAETAVAIGQDGVEKQETVYVMTDEYGNPGEIVVSDWLKGSGDSGNFTDYSDLENIENVKSNDKFTDNNGNITWDTSGSDIYYQGTTKKTPPVSISVKYYLDGMEKTAEEMEGSSGHVRIRLSYTNNEKGAVDGVEYYSPYVALSAVVLNNENFKNVSVSEGGAVIDDGNRSIAVAFASPGMNENLGLDEDNSLPDEIDIEADAEDFSLLTILSAVTNKPFADGNDLDMSSFDEMQEDLDDLLAASEELKDGASELLDGSTKFADGISSFADGTSDIASGASDLASGTSSLSKNMKDFRTGTSGLSSGASDLASGTSELAEQSGLFASGASDLAENTAKLTEGTSSLSSGALELEKGTASLADGMGDISKGATSVKNNMGTIAGGLGQAAEGAKKVADGTDKIYSSLNGMGSEISKASAGAGAIETGAAYLSDGMVSASGAIESSMAGDRQVLEALKNMDPSGSDPTISTLINTLEQTIAAQDTVSKSLGKGGQLYDAADKLTDGASELKKGIDDMGAVLGASVPQVKELNDGAKQLSGSINMLSLGSDELYKGTEQLESSLGQASGGAAVLKDGAKQVNSGAGQVDSGAKQLSDGASKISGGADQINDAIKKIDYGTGTLKDGAKIIDDSAKQLSDGSSKLSSGAARLNGGTKALESGAKTLNESAGELESGIRTLNDGIGTFNKEGIQALYDGLNEKLLSKKDILKAISDIASQHDNFSGKVSGMKSSTTYIYRTQSIG